MNKVATLVILLVSLTGLLAVSLEKRDGEHALHERDHGHEHEHNDYHEPAGGYEAPSHSSYDPPSVSYSSYSEPSTSYGEPSYEASSYEAEPYNPLSVLTPIIIGIMALLGLSLLFPNNVRIDNVRRKRSSAEGKRVNSYTSNDGNKNQFSLTYFITLTEFKAYN